MDETISASRSYCPEGLRVEVDGLVHEYDPERMPAGRPHRFVYYLTIHNGSARRVVLLGRKWIIYRSDGAREVIEGDGIVGQTPDLDPGQSFSYNSFHVTGADCEAEGAFFGLDEEQRRVHVRVPRLRMSIPAKNW